MVKMYFCFYICQKNNMKNIFFLSVIFLMTLFAVSCTSKEFKVEGKFSDAGTQNLRFVYVSGDAIHTQWMPTVDGTFTLIGSSDELTVVYVYSSQMRFITHFAVKNGQTITVEGQLKDNYNVTTKGNKESEEWNAFIVAHASDFKAKNSEKIDQTIAEFIKANPENVVSTLLLTCDYSDIRSEEARKLFESIDEKARPEQLTILYNDLLLRDIEKQKPLTVLNLRNSKDSLETVQSNEAKLSLYYFWKESNSKRDSIVSQLKRLEKNVGKGNIRIIDISIKPDTFGWGRIVARDSVMWKHYVAVGGPVDKTIADLNISAPKYFILTDSTGTQLYRGVNVEEACKEAESTIQNK